MQQATAATSSVNICSSCLQEQLLLKLIIIFCNPQQRHILLAAHESTYTIIPQCRWLHAGHGVGRQCCLMCQTTVAAMMSNVCLQTAGPDGSLLFSYVQTDDYCERYETSRSITTSRWEGQNHLANKLLVDPRNRQKVGSWASQTRTQQQHKYEQGHH